MTKRPYNKKHSIRHWASKYGIPENSCYMAFRRRGIGEFKRGKGIGAAKPVNEREFLAGVLFTKSGREIVSKLILKGMILTDDEIKDSLPSEGS